MTNAVPDWWLWVSAAFFAVNLLFFLALAVVMLKIVALVKDLGPKVGELTTKVEGLVVKVEEVSTQVTEVAQHVKETVTDVGQKTSSILGSIEQIATTASKQFERFSPFVIGAMTAMKLVRAVADFRQERTFKGKVEKKSKNLLERLLPDSKPKEKKKLLGLFG